MTPTLAQCVRALIKLNGTQRVTMVVVLKESLEKQACGHFQVKTCICLALVTTTKMPLSKAFNPNDKKKLNSSVSFQKSRHT